MLYLYLLALTSFLFSAITLARNAWQCKNTGEWVFMGLIGIPLYSFSAICFIYALGE